MEESAVMDPDDEYDNIIDSRSFPGHSYGSHADNSKGVHGQ